MAVPTVRVRRAGARSFGLKQPHDTPGRQVAAFGGDETAGKRRYAAIARCRLRRRRGPAGIARRPRFAVSGALSYLERGELSTRWSLQTSCGSARQAEQPRPRGVHKRGNRARPRALRSAVGDRVMAKEAHAPRIEATALD